MFEEIEKLLKEMRNLLEGISGKLDVLTKCVDTQLDQDPPHISRLRVEGYGTTPVEVVSGHMDVTTHDPH